MPAPSRDLHTYSFEAIGTPWSIDSAAPLSPDLIQSIDDYCTRFNAEYSRFESDSLVTKLANDGGSATFSSGVPELFSFYDQLYELTDGAVSPLIGRALEDLGYDAEYSLTSKAVRETAAYSEVLSHSDNTVVLTRPALIDVGAAGKGFLIDELSRLISQEQSDFVVDGSGDVFVSNILQRIGLEHPHDTTKIIGHIEVDTGAVCASASNRRAWGNGLHHILDARTNQPVSNVIATWVLADSGRIADGLATALFFDDAQVLAPHFSFSFVVMRADGSVQYSNDARITMYD